MFSVIFPGQGSQMVGMGKEFYNKFDLVKKLFKEADDALNFHISKLVLDGPKEELDLTINTQPAIFLISYSIFNVVKKEFNIDLFKAKYFAGHSLGEYSALSCAGYLNFPDSITSTASIFICEHNLEISLEKAKFKSPYVLSTSFTISAVSKFFKIMQCLVILLKSLFAFRAEFLS